ncbi:hypothetical protein ANCCEY_06119 [Ancylostoma ceylanicum]|uniref:Uncharacterized protein n=1 Tax=Ancylostoma ceylanicum TaxID=53326 RepID=A0A0D6M4I7_9BILA|nr:hypothetical protein ANCCEY_06119 [Ancylostoma ceylanicum]
MNHIPATVTRTAERTSASSFNSYFVFIIFVRSVFEYKDFKGPALKFGFNMMRLALIALFEVLLCYKIEGDFEHGQVAVRKTKEMTQ